MKSVAAPGGDLDDEPADGYEDWVGRIVDGRYRIEEVVGEGGMGAVFAAKHLKLGRRVAIKIIHREHAGNEEIVQRFAREVEANARLEHAHIVNAIDCGSMPDGGAYLVMELAKGRSLAEAFDDGVPLGWRTACKLGAQIADALHAAHSAGIIHRDLKPHNILLVEGVDGERAKILDFGIARFMDDGADEVPPLTKLGTVLGSVGYMAPEQGLGQPVDERVDLYTLGILLWEMVAATPLFDGPGLTLTSFVTEQLSDIPRPIAEVVPDQGVPPELDALIQRLLAPKKEDRPFDAGEVRDELRELADAVQPNHEQLPSTAAAELGTLLKLQAVRLRAALSSALKRFLKLPPQQIAIVATLVGILVSTCMLGILVLLLWPSSAEERVVVASPTQEPVATPAPTPPAPEPIPQRDQEIEAAVALLLGSEAEWRARHEAAGTILNHEPRDDVEPLALHLARLQRSNCNARVRAIEELGQLEDGRALGPLLRHRAVASRGRHPCGRNFPTEIDHAIRRIRNAESTGEP